MVAMVKKTMLVVVMTTENGDDKTPFSWADCTANQGNILNHRVLSTEVESNPLLLTLDPTACLTNRAPGKRCHVTFKSGSDDVLQPSCPAALLGHPGSPRPHVSLAIRRACHWESALGDSPS